MNLCDELTVQKNIITQTMAEYLKRYAINCDKKIRIRQFHFLWIKLYRKKLKYMADKVNGQKKK